MPYEENTFKPEWIQNETGLTRESIQWAREFGKFLAKTKYENNKKVKEQLSTSQIRRFFGLIKRLQAKGYDENSRSDLLMLTPQLAYAVGRDKKKIRGKVVDTSKIHYFYQEISSAIDAINAGEIETEQKYFKNFVNLVEAIVAYHKFAGGE